MDPTLKPETLSLFEREMHDQVAAAQGALAEAERRDDPLLVQAAKSHLDGLLDLARRNGVLIQASQSEVIPALPA
jgi:hypothetical protein